MPGKAIQLFRSNCKVESLLRNIGFVVDGIDFKSVRTLMPIADQYGNMLLEHAWDFVRAKYSVRESRSRAFNVNEREQILDFMDEFVHGADDEREREWREFAEAGWSIFRENAMKWRYIERWRQYLEKDTSWVAADGKGWGILFDPFTYAPALATIKPKAADRKHGSNLSDPFGRSFRPGS